MSIEELKKQFADISEDYGAAVQAYLASCPCDADTKIALDEIVRLTFEAIARSQDAVADYLENQ